MEKAAAEDKAILHFSAGGGWFQRPLELLTRGLRQSQPCCQLGQADGGTDEAYQGKFVPMPRAEASTSYASRRIAGSTKLCGAGGLASLGFAGPSGTSSPLTARWLSIRHPGRIAGSLCPAAGERPQGRRRAPRQLRSEPGGRPTNRRPPAPYSSTSIAGPWNEAPMTNSGPPQRPPGLVRVRRACCPARFLNHSGTRCGWIPPRPGQLLPKKSPERPKVPGASRDRQRIFLFYLYNWFANSGGGYWGRSTLPPAT